MITDTPIRAILYYLRRYLAAEPGRPSLLIAEYRKKTGKDLHRSTLWRHLKLTVEPPASTLLIYLVFLHRERAIKASKRTGKLFIYAFPALLK